MTAAAKTDSSRTKKPWLDLLRAAAAFEVVLFHLNAMMFGSADQNASAVRKAFGHLVSHGPEAVMVFFVLSGYLVGGHVLFAVVDGRWSWSSYLSARMTRLWIVLIPALALTLLWDSVGAYVLHGDFYLGRIDFNVYHIGDTNLLHHEASVLLGNLLFLQSDILVPAYGSDFPLWSLANEFWYYAIFPLAVSSILGRRSMSRRVLSGAGAVALCAALPPKITAYGLVWLLGVIVAARQRRAERWLEGPARALLGAAALVAFLASLYLSSKWRGLGQFGADVSVGASFALVLAFLAEAEMRSQALKRISAFFADCSYTLYLTHFPFIIVALCLIQGDATTAPSPSALALFAGLLCLTVVYAVVVYSLFERHTKAVQGWLSRLRLCPLA